MSSLKMSWIMVFSILLIMGWAITPAQAHCAGKHTGDHPHCAGGEPPVSAMNQEIVTVQSDGKQQINIVVMNPDGTDPQVVWKSGRGAFVAEVSWSGDGSNVLFRGEVNGQDGIYWVQVFELDESNARTAFAPGQPQFVTSTGSDARWSPNAAPDGNYWIVYQDVDPNEVPPPENLQSDEDLYLVNPSDPDDKIRLTNTPGRSEYHPTWSPNADRIAFISVPNDKGCSCPGDIEIIHLYDDNGTLKVQDRVSLILQNPDPETGWVKDKVANTFFWNTDWSNTSNPERIVTTINEKSQIWVFPTNPLDVALEAKDINNDPALSYFRPVWSPGDDALIYIRDGHGGVCDIPDTSEPPLQGGPFSYVMAPLLPDPPNQIEEIDICAATLPLDWLGRWYEWWRGGGGLSLLPAP